MKLHYSRDETDRLRATAEPDDPRGRFLARFLETDVGDPVHAAELLRAAKRAIGPAQRISGNAFSVAIGPKRTTLAAHVKPRTGPASIALPTAEFRSILASWLRLLETPRTRF
ncbi:MAG: hypothetical protein KatS3mg108_1065 [Isosphaeraceae bacterium]|jgi:hypothetical protein|nr:MAG: hypothetical protein KatS3mg108_1065 [Isosphaeraceae bacterium]